jgi:hypothetical protein
MAHFAQLDENNNIINVVVVKNEVILDSDGVEQETLGIEFLKQLNGADTVWKQTSRNTMANQRTDGSDKAPFRYNYAFIDGKYNSEHDGFETPKPFNSWTLNTSTLQYEPPIAQPQETETHFWNWNEDLYQGDTNDPKTLGWQRYNVDTGELDPPA